MKKITDDSVSNCCGAPVGVNGTCSDCKEPCEKEYLGEVVILPTKNSEQSIIWGPTKIKLVNKQAEKLEKWGLVWNDDDWIDFMQYNCVPKETYEELRTKLSFNWEEVAKEWEASAKGWQNHAIKLQKRFEKLNEWAKQKDCMKGVGNFDRTKEQVYIMLNEEIK